MKPTGFEEFFADAPITPAAFEEEQSIYDRFVSFFFFCRQMWESADWIHRDISFET